MIFLNAQDLSKLANDLLFNISTIAPQLLFGVLIVVLIILRIFYIFEKYFS